MRGLNRVFFISLALLFGSLKPVYAADFVAGIEYQEIIPAQQTTAPAGKVEVVELFWYGCSHCYRMEPALKKWLANKPANVHFVRMPAQLNKGWEIHAGAYFVAEALGIVDKVHEPIFKAIHANRKPHSKPKLMKVDELAAFFLKFGVSREKFMKIYNSFSTRNKLAHARGMGQRYGARSVPTFIVNGKYRTNETMAGGHKKDMFAVIDKLIADESKAGK